MINNFATQYLPPMLAAFIVMLALVLAIAIISRSGSTSAWRLWRGIVQQRAAIGGLGATILFIVAISTFLVRNSASMAQLQSAQRQASLSQNTPSNLLSTGPLPLAPLTHTVIPLEPSVTGPNNGSKPGQEGTGTRELTDLPRQMLVATNAVIVQPGQGYRLSLSASTSGSEANATGLAQVRELWFGPAFNLVTYKDNPPWQVRAAQEPASGRGSVDGFYTAAYKAPEGATRLQLEVRNIGTTSIQLRSMGLFAQGVYVEPHPNGAQGAIAFSFDWESAMGGAIHSQGMTTHDVAGATEHGLLMRKGADWLNKLFTDNEIHATFYGTGYNLLDGNTQHLTFSGNPTYKFASPKNNWRSDYWLTHPWYSDDPLGSGKTDPAWYFGDQTRALLAAGHEIASHTFGHLYVRGTTTDQLATDMDEWLKAARALQVPSPTTFAFPWRSSNSLTADFYDVLYKRGIRAVTRVYAPDLRDLFALGAAPVFTDMAVMPDFLLGEASSSAGEEAAGAPIGLDQGKAVIAETLARRGTTSFWNHPEQLGDLPELQPVRAAWTGIVQAAAKERDAGRLWIGTVAGITAYQRDMMSVTVSLDHDASSSWSMTITNNSGHEIQGVTLTLPADAVALSSPSTEIRTVKRPTETQTVLSAAGQPAYPARQLVITSLRPGRTSLDVTWATGEEPE